MSDRRIPPQQGDEQALFERYEAPLRRATAAAVRTSPDNIQDACAHAWMTLFTGQPRRATAFAYLKTVARNEAIRLDRQARVHVPIGQQEDDSRSHSSGEPEPSTRSRTAETTQGLLELRERLSALPERERQVTFMHAAGWTYAELGERLGISYTRVNQLLSRASLRMRDMDMQEHPVDSERGRRLQQVEREPPTYIVASIGRPPPTHQRKRGYEFDRREWRRLVLAIEDYRSRRGITDPVLPLGERNVADPAQETLAKHVTAFRKDRRLGLGFEL